ncbi:hypothetical protein V8C86DRAFT_2592841 [Haematococcus lacustris]
MSISLRRIAASVAFSLLLLAACATQADAGPLGGLAAYGTCQTGCNTVVCACYAAFGVTFGAAGVAAIPACGAAQGVCMAACAQMTLAAIVAPTPSITITISTAHLCADATCQL